VASGVFQYSSFDIRTTPVIPEKSGI